MQDKLILHMLRSKGLPLTLGIRRGNCSPLLTLPDWRRPRAQAVGGVSSLQDEALPLASGLQAYELMPLDLALVRACGDILLGDTATL